MIDKMNGQLALGHRLRGVNVRPSGLQRGSLSLLTDLRGNLNAYGRPKVRCLKCAHSYRRMPLSAVAFSRKKRQVEAFRAWAWRRRREDCATATLP